MTSRHASHVPVEHRWFGLDRRTFPPALAALGVSLALLFGWQAVNAAIPWDDPTVAGEVLDLGDGATAVPPVGWQRQDGLLVGEGSVNPTSFDVVLTDGGATIGMRGTTFDGSAEEFLEQIERSEDADVAGLDGGRGSVTTHDGLVGVTQSRSGPSGDQLDVVFKMSTTDGDTAPALLVRINAAPGQFEKFHRDFAEMIDTIAVGAGS